MKDKNYMKATLKSTDEVRTQIKNPDLVKQRRRQIVEAAVPLFIENGYHKTTTRQIARRAGISVGSMYEYVTSKEDILYLVCVSIHDMVENGIEKALSRATGGRETLEEVLREYFMICHHMREYILLMYQVTQSLPAQWQQKVLENEIRITGLFIGVLARIVAAGDLPHLAEHSFDLIAHNISVLGHQWAFRGWYLTRHYTIEGYIKFQTDFILGIAAGKKQ
jgi:TetR/AcrR family transcriptional regulator, cholesterol catabolism regulator